MYLKLKTAGFKKQTNKKNRKKQNKIDTTFFVAQFSNIDCSIHWFELRWFKSLTQKTGVGFQTLNNRLKYLIVNFKCEH